MTEFQPITIRMSVEQYEKIRRLAYLRKEHISDIVRVALETVIEKNKRLLTSSITAV